jgi:hypothetical protein
MVDNLTIVKKEEEEVMYLIFFFLNVMLLFLKSILYYYILKKYQYVKLNITKISENNNVLNIDEYIYCYHIPIIVLKPGPAWHVDLELDRLGAEAGPG